MAINIVPINDIEEHIEDTTCWCVPEIIEESGTIIIKHNAFDGRTLNEKDNDETGERRYWAIKCEHKIDREAVAADRDLLWKEARVCSPLAKVSPAIRCCPT